MASRNEALDVFCTALEMKERKRALYEDAMKTCPDQVGVETFRMLKEAEQEHIGQIQKLYEELKQGKVDPGVCQFHEFESEDRKAILRKIAEQHGKMPKACLDDVVAIETGLQLEDAGIQFFSKCLEKAQDPMERELLERMIVEERQHYILLADLKFYYTDPQAWFMEKSRARLDGAGGVA
jgi:rubrerythrin